MSSLEYTTQPPTKPGYYWLKFAETEEVVEVWRDPAGQEQTLWVHRCGDGECCEFASLATAQWAGPIPKPD